MPPIPTSDLIKNSALPNIEQLLKDLSVVLTPPIIDINYKKEIDHQDPKIFQLNSSIYNLLLTIGFNEEQLADVETLQINGSVYKEIATAIKGRESDLWEALISLFAVLGGLTGYAYTQETLDAYFHSADPILLLLLILSVSAAGASGIMLMNVDRRSTD